MLQQLQSYFVVVSLLSLAAMGVAFLFVRAWQRLTRITIADGQPVVSPDPFSPRRRYTVLGKQSLTNGEWCVAGPESRFFKVKVSLP